jgi:DNA helicase-4
MSVRLIQGLAADLPCLDIVGLSVAKGFLWSTLDITTRDRTIPLRHLRPQAAAILASKVREFVNQDLCRRIGLEIASLRRVDTEIRQIVARKERYLAQGDVAQLIAGLSSEAYLVLSHPLFDKELAPASLQTALPDTLSFLTDAKIREQYNEEFVHAELARRASFFDNLDGRSLSAQQREASVRLEDNNLLVASAGSGKSATMVGKIAYVLDAGLYSPEEILVLAFNKNAADELRERVARQLGIEQADLASKITTFHALGRSIIAQSEGRPPRLADWVDHPAGEAKVIEQIIDKLLKANPEFSRLWIDLLALHPKADRPTEVFDLEADRERYLSSRREKGNATIGTLSGTYVKSLQEQTIANWLWLHSVDFDYERQVEIEDASGAKAHVHPDFYYPASETVHEHFAIDADGSSPFPNYVEHARSKVAGYRRAAMDFFQTTSAQAGDGLLVTTLEAELKARDIPLVRKNYQAIVDALEPVVIKHYHRLITASIKRIRSSHLTLELLLERTKSLQDQPRGRAFAQAIWLITEAYSLKLREAERIDFDSMLANATRLVEDGRYQSPFSLILADEFQDITEASANLIKALKQQRPSTRLFAVGDDWQSIYRFAGSDISIFTEFEAHFGVSWLGRLEQTYRCNQLIAETAASFVQRNPAQLKKSVRSIRPAVPKSIRVIPVDGERGKPDFSDACRRVLTRLDTFLGAISDQWRRPDQQKLKVLVLWRYNQLDPFKEARPRFEYIEVSGLSFHKAKGLEADYTLLLDISEGDYGVPSQIEDDELLDLVMPMPEALEYAEERRLFYVALTRASRGVFLLTNSKQQSRFIRELSEIAGPNVRFESIDGDLLVLCPSCHVGQMVQRQAGGDSRFLGCNQYPDCDHTAPIN